MAKKTKKQIQYSFFKSDVDVEIKNLGKKGLLRALEAMLLIRHFEQRAEAAYQDGKIGGFFHAYMGQEAIQTAAVFAMGVSPHWWVTTYRCHALALLMGVHPNEIMAELFGKANGNALGRGGSMHLYADRMLGGFGIVGGHLPIATGAAFSLKYQGQKGASICFLGEGAFVQGAVHESLNLASLWDLPCLYVIENNRWGMGTAVDRALCAQPIAERFAPAYKMDAYTFDGMDFFNCYAGFRHVHEAVKKKGRPILIEAVTERFRGHSISDPGLYRSKAELEEAKARDPIHLFSETLKKQGLITNEEWERCNQNQKDIAIASLAHAEKSPPPDLTTLEEDVFAP